MSINGLEVVGLHNFMISQNENVDPQSTFSLKICCLSFLRLYTAESILLPVPPFS